jgi:hypothetical protein
MSLPAARQVMNLNKIKWCGIIKRSKTGVFIKELPVWGNSY